MNAASAQSREQNARQIDVMIGGDADDAPKST
jgi:hypothetical protein